MKKFLQSIRDSIPLIGRRTVVVTDTVKSTYTHVPVHERNDLMRWYDAADGKPFKFEESLRDRMEMAAANMDESPVAYMLILGEYIIVLHARIEALENER